MVLRRPYAFLIKHFRLIHLIITAIFAYIALLSRDIYKYLSSVISNTTNRYNASIYTNYIIFLYILIALLLCAIVYWLLKYKDKPRRIYLFTILGYVVVGTFMLLLFNYMGSFSNNIIDQKTIRLYRDILLMVQFFEYYIIIVMFIRGLGFDIKKFNFNKDVQELNATLEDSEEIEIDTKIDTTNIARRVRKQGRELGYFYKEFKVYILIILALIVIFLGYKGYNYFTAKLKVYKENEPIGRIFNVTIKNSYYYVDETDNYVIIKFDANKRGIKEMLNTGIMTLTIGRDTYTPDKNVCYKFAKLGTCYKRQYISSKKETYILTYKVDKLNIEKAHIKYNESYDKTYKVKLQMQAYQE